MVKMPEFGHAVAILKVDLSAGKTARLLTADYAGRLLGGRGVAARTGMWPVTWRGEAC